MSFKKSSEYSTGHVFMDGTIEAYCIPKLHGWIYSIYFHDSVSNVYRQVKHIRCNIFTAFIGEVDFYDVLKELNAVAVYEEISPHEFMDIKNTFDQSVTPTSIRASQDKFGMVYCHSGKDGYTCVVYESHNDSRFLQLISANSSFEILLCEDDNVVYSAKGIPTSDEDQLFNHAIMGVDISKLQEMYKFMQFCVEECSLPIELK